MRNKIIAVSFIIIPAIWFFATHPDHKAQADAVRESFEPLVVKSALPLSGTVKAYAANLSEPRKTDVVVSSGVPFSPGQISDERNIAVLDLQGNEMPVAVKVLARWPYDGSIRSALVQFDLKIDHKYKQVLIRWGSPRKSADKGVQLVYQASPEGILIMPPKWLCYSKVLGEQVPAGESPFPAYDERMETYYPKIASAQWSQDPGKDGYYSTPHVFYQMYVRTGNEEYFKTARKELLHYREDQIIQDGPEKGRAKSANKTRYIYVEALVDDYLLTGDEKSLRVAGYMADYFMKYFDPKKVFLKRSDTRFWTEREVAFPLLGVLNYYEVTGDKKYLDFAGEIVKNLHRTQKEWPEMGGFIHNLYSHDPEEGARKDEFGGSPFMTGLLLEGIVKYHQLTGSSIAKESIYMALDWLMKYCLAPSGDTFIYLTCDKWREEGHPDLNMLIVHAFGYGYKMSGGVRKDYLDIGNRLFARGVKSARLTDRKHFNQNYRSSGYFLGYTD